MIDLYEQYGIRPLEVIKHLTLTGKAQPIFAEILQRKVVLGKANELGIVASDEDLQYFTDTFRVTHGLYSAEETLSFLETAGTNQEDFETFCESSVLLTAIKDHLADNKSVREYFINHRSEFDVARISIIVTASEDLANELVMRIIEDEDDFHQLAREYSLDDATKYSGGYVGVVNRRSLSPRLAAKVFNANAGDVLGPFPSDENYQLILVEEVKKTEMNDPVKNAIKEAIFNEWISQHMNNPIIQERRLKAPYIKLGVK